MAFVFQVHWYVCELCDLEYTSQNKVECIK